MPAKRRPKTRTPSKRETAIVPTPSVPPSVSPSDYPFAGLDRMSRLMSRRFGDILGFGPFGGFPYPGIAPPFPGRAFRPVFSDIEDNGKAYVVRSELPGVKKEDIKITVREGHVEITAQSATTIESGEAGSSIYRERSHGSFYRAFNLPAEIDSEHTEALLQDGVLTLTLPKVNPTQTKGKTIPVR